MYKFKKKNFFYILTELPEPHQLPPLAQALTLVLVTPFLPEPHQNRGGLPEPALEKCKGCPVAPPLSCKAFAPKSSKKHKSGSGRAKNGSGRNFYQNREKRGARSLSHWLYVGETA
jgi:hypothetical protein